MNGELRSRAWVLTINNYQEKDILEIKGLKGIVYYIVGQEIAPRTGTPHLQIYLHYKNATKFQTLKKKFPTAHIQPAKGTAAQNKVYCSKESVLLEYGDLPKQGKRTDIEEVRDVLNEGGRMRDIIPIAKSTQSVRMAEIHLSYFEKKRDWKPKVRWYWGEAGTGKTHEAHKLMTDPYIAMTSSKWWQGYDAHEEVIIDDMRRDFCKFHELLRIIDRYAFQVECKGGARQFVAKHIIITSCFSPYKLYDTREDIRQLIRRIDEIREFSWRTRFDKVLETIQRRTEPETTETSRTETETKETE